MKKIKGVNKIGSGFVDNNFEKGLIELLQGNIIIIKYFY